jgi:eukaryotic-like serine/threonine-protein kinase
VTDAFQPEQVISGRYRVLRKLGGGGMADVFLCEDLTLGRHVALKVLLKRFHDDPNFVERFRREAKAAAGLNHPNLVSIYDWGEVDHTYFIVMEYVEGETLKDLVRRLGRLSGNEAVQLTLQLLAAVAFAHRHGIVHRDIKPQNVMLDRDGNVKVMDFGIARAGDSGMTEAGSILGTAQYLAPEQARGLPVDGRSDLYSVGIVLYEMLTGTVPFKGDSAVTVALKHVNEMASEPATLVPGLPYSLNQIVLKAIAKSPADRFQTAEEFARDLRAAQQGGQVGAAAFDPGAERTRVMAGGATSATAVLPSQTPLDEITADRRRRRSRWPIVLVVILLLIIAAAAYGVWRVMDGGTIAVPSLVGQSQAVAVRTLQAKHLTADIQHEYSDQFAAGFVSRQSPPAGKKLREEGAVTIWVSKGATTVSLIDFRGLTAAAVADYLTTNDLVGSPQKGRNANVTVGSVYRQDPPAGATVKRGDTVKYWISTGKPQATVPDLTGMTVSDAQAALAAQGLTLGTPSQESSTSVSAGLVIRQDPPADTKVPRGTVVNVVVSTGAPTPTPTPSTSSSAALVPVPNVYTQDATTATDLLHAQGFAVVVKEHASNEQPGTVIKMRPDAATLVAPGTTIVLTIAK